MINESQVLLKRLRKVEDKVEKISRKDARRSHKADALTIQSGNVTVGQREYYRLIPETGTTDDLVNILGFSDGYLLTIQTDDPTDTITVKNTGNISVPVDRVLSDPNHALFLIYSDFLSEWVELVYNRYGSGSGLDADTLDGLDSTDFALAAHVHAGEDITTGTVADARIDSTITRDSEVFGIVLGADGPGSGLNADFLDGLDSAAFALAAHVHAGEDITTGTVADARIASTITRDSEVFGIVLGADGPGSGLNADLLDGLDSIAFFILGGQAGGQIARGDTASGGNLTLMSTVHATKGKILFGTSAYDEVNHRLGIGTASPSSILELDPGNAGAILLNFDDTTGGFFGVTFKDSTSGNNKWQMGVASDSFSTAGLQNALYWFQYRDKAETSINLYRMMLSDAGFLGIGTGTNAPQALLHVGAGTDASGLGSALILASAAGNVAISARDSTNDIETFIFSGPTTGIVGTFTNHNLALRTNNATRATVTAAGNLEMAGTLYMAAARFRALTVSGVELFDDGGSGLKVVDGGGVEVNPASTSVAGMIVDTPSGSLQPIYLGRNAGNLVFTVFSDADERNFFLYDLPSTTANGAGPYFHIGRNSSATPAPGCFGFAEADGSGNNYIYTDNSSIYRTLTALPTALTFAGGTVIGSQTSMAAAKDFYEQISTIEEVLARVRVGADAVRRFSYKSGRFNNEVYEGVVTDHAPEYGDDRDSDHPYGKILNEVVIPADLLRAVSWLVEEVEKLRRQ